MQGTGVSALQTEVLFLSAMVTGAAAAAAAAAPAHGLPLAHTTRQVCNRDAIMII